MDAHLGESTVGWGAVYCPNRECPDFVQTGFHAEFVAGVTVCPACGAYLVDRLPDNSDDSDVLEKEPRPDTEVEPVFETGDPTEVTVVRSLLEASGVPYVTLGAESFDTFRGGRSPMSFNPTSGSVIFLVPRQVAEHARALLAEVEGDGEP